VCRQTFSNGALLHEHAGLPSYAILNKDGNFFPPLVPPCPRFSMASAGRKFIGISSRVLPEWISTRGLPHGSPTIFRFFNDCENRPLYASIPSGERNSFHFDLTEMHATTAQSHEIANIWSFSACSNRSLLLRKLHRYSARCLLIDCSSMIDHENRELSFSDRHETFGLATLYIISFHDNDTRTKRRRVERSSLWLSVHIVDRVRLVPMK